MRLYFVVGSDSLHESGHSGEADNMDTEKGCGSPPRMDYREGTANITDYSPEWAYTEVSNAICSLIEKGYGQFMLIAMSLEQWYVEVAGEKQS